MPFLDLAASHAPFIDIQRLPAILDRDGVTISTRFLASPQASLKAVSGQLSILF
jgi:hypothetical protein